jgi:hypothetical protein
MPVQLPLFTNSKTAISSPVFAPLPPSSPPLIKSAWPLATWQDVSDVGMEVGLPLAYAERDLFEFLHDPDGALLWDVLWTTHYYLEVLRENSARFTLNFGDKDYRFVAVHLLPAGIMVRLDSVQPER